VDDALHGLDDLGAAAVVEGDVQGDPGVVAGERNSIEDLPRQAGGDAIQAPQVANAHTFRMELAQLALDLLLKKAQKLKLLMHLKQLIDLVKHNLLVS